METKIAIFKGKQVRKVIHSNEWWFSVIDVVEVLTDSANSRRYWSDLKRNLKEKEGFSELYGRVGLGVAPQAPHGTGRADF